MIRQWALLMSVASASTMCVANARAIAVYDLTAAGSSVTINGAVFSQGVVQPAGSGVADSFLRVQANGTEQGYNTSGGTPFDDKSGVSLNNGGVTVGDLTFGTFNSVADQTQIWLDINEAKGGKDSFGQSESLISLDSLQIYVSPTAGQTTTTVSSLGTLVYDMGTKPVLLDAATNSGGSGKADASILLAKSLFTPFASTDSFYLYAHFGNAADTSGGFEEFLLFNDTASNGGGGGTPPPVPEPMSLALLPLAIAGLGMRLRSKR